jgi:hypothetical protein
MTASLQTQRQRHNGRRGALPVLPARERTSSRPNTQPTRSIAFIGRTSAACCDHPSACAVAPRARRSATPAEGQLRTAKARDGRPLARAGFHLYWNWLSRRRRSGRHTVAAEVRLLVRRLATENRPRALRASTVSCGCLALTSPSTRCRA